MRNTAPWVATLACVVWGAACSSSATHAGKADDLVVLVDASFPPTMPMADSGYDSSAYGDESVAYGSVSPSFTPEPWCTACGCSRGTSCTVLPVQTAGPGTCASSAAAAAGYAVSCVPLDGSCDASDCVCLLEGLMGQRCYTDCTPNGGIPVLYCMR
jgi:hypothetical protein